jgi:heme/copper-type cytochrome/quinol oxidase subunit 1
VPMLWCLGIIAMFTIAGADGVYMSFIPLDIYLHDTWWLVSHFHYIIFGSTVMGTIAAIYYWFPAVMHRKLSEKAGLWHFWLTMIGMNLTFFPMHNLGLHGLQRRIWTYPAEFTAVNVLIGIGTLITVAAQLVFIGNIIHTMLKSKEIEDEEAWGKTHLNVGGPMLEDAEPALSKKRTTGKGEAPGETT